MKKPLVYIAGPFSHPDPVINTRKAIAVGEYAESMGCVPFIPHLTIAWHLVSPQPVETWYRRDLEVLEHCNALFRFPGPSEGADKEVEFARKHLIPVFQIVQMDPEEELRQPYFTLRNTYEFNEWLKAFYNVHSYREELALDARRRADERARGQASNVEFQDGIAH